MNRREPIAWMVYTVDGKSAYVTDNPSDIKEGQSAYALYPGPFEQLLLTEKEMYAVEEEARKNFRLSQLGPRGQQITYWDVLTPWLIRAVEKASWEKNHG